MTALRLPVTGSVDAQYQTWTETIFLSMVPLGLVIASLLWFAVGPGRQGGFRDHEVESRGSTWLLGPWLRQYFAWITRLPLLLLSRFRVSANAVTLLSLQFAIGAGVALAADRVAIGAWLLAAAGCCDFLDGRLARNTGTATSGGALMDSVFDRYAEAAAYLGLAWLYRRDWILLAVLLALAGSFIVPYVRARGESLGVALAHVGSMQRAERAVVLTVAVWASPLLDPLLPAHPLPKHPLLVLAICFLAVTSQVSAVQRILRARSALANAQPALPKSRVGAKIPERVVASGLATAAEFAVTILLIRSLKLSPLTAIVCGSASGPLLHAVLYWHCRSAALGSAALLAKRCVVISVGSAALNSGLIALILVSYALPYLAVWLFVRAFVLVTWNYPLCRDYLSNHPAATGPWWWRNGLLTSRRQSNMRPSAVSFGSRSSG